MRPSEWSRKSSINWNTTSFWIEFCFNTSVNCPSDLLFPYCCLWSIEIRFWQLASWWPRTRTLFYAGHAYFFVIMQRQIRVEVLRAIRYGTLPFWAVQFTVSGKELADELTCCLRGGVFLSKSWKLFSWPWQPLLRYLKIHYMLPRNPSLCTFLTHFSSLRNIEPHEPHICNIVHKFRLQFGEWFGKENLAFRPTKHETI